MQFHVCCAQENGRFSVPAQAVDLHIRNASGAYFKVLLVLLCNQTEGLSSDAVAGQTSIPVDEVEAAVRYWISCKLLPESVLFGAEAAKPVDAPPSVRLTAREVNDLVRQNREIAFLFDSAETLFGRPVTATEQKALVSMHEWMGLPVDVILMLIGYCLSIEKRSIRYIDKMAASWSDEGIVTLELAEEKIQKLKEKDSRFGKVKAAFGIHGRTLTTNEKKYITRWTEEYGFSMPLIQRAYEITVDNTGKVAFAYINKILTSWHEKGFRTLEDTEQEKPPKPPKRRIVPENDSFDVRDFEDMGLYDVPDVKDGV